MSGPNLSRRGQFARAALPAVIQMIAGLPQKDKRQLQRELTAEGKKIGWHEAKFSYAIADAMMAREQPEIVLNADELTTVRSALLMGVAGFDKYIAEGDPSRAEHWTEDELKTARGEMLAVLDRVGDQIGGGESKRERA